MYTGNVYPEYPLLNTPLIVHFKNLLTYLLTYLLMSDHNRGHRFPSHAKLGEGVGAKLKAKGAVLPLPRTATESVPTNDFGRKSVRGSVQGSAVCRRPECTRSAPHVRAIVRRRRIDGIDL